MGDVTSTVEVQANAVHVATDSSDRSISIDLRQIDDTPTRGRNPLSVIMTLPGVQTAGVERLPRLERRRHPGRERRTAGPDHPQHGRRRQPGLGQPESRLHLAQHGRYRRSPSAGLQLHRGVRRPHRRPVDPDHQERHPAVPRHAYYYYRHESFNANTFFNNKTNVPRPRYRYQNPGGTIGGPLIIPGTSFNKSRQKLFFFFSYDILRNNTVGTATYTMPSALERAGDFSQTVTTTGVQVPIYRSHHADPFPGNIIPTNRISPQGQAMLNLFPLPDPQGLALDPTGQPRLQLPRYPAAVEAAGRQDPARGLQLLAQGGDLRAPVAGLPGAERLRRYRRTSRRRLGPVPGSYHVQAVGRRRHHGLHLLARP